MSDGTVRDRPFRKIILRLSEAGQAEAEREDASPCHATACVPKRSGWQLRAGRSCRWHRRCPCAGPITPGRALVLDRVRKLRPARTRVKPRAIIAASILVGVASAHLLPLHAALLSLLA